MAVNVRADIPSRMMDFGPIVDAMISRHDIRVRHWRSAMTGKAWQTLHTDGRVTRWVESPRPRTPLSLGIFLHEVGHHVIGFDRYKRRCEEEYHAWIWALTEMRRHGVEPDAKLLKRFDLSMRYAVAKALRRGIRNVPESVRQFLPAAA
jgi:hypothetical protein